MTFFVRLFVSIFIIAGIAFTYLATHSKDFQLDYFNWLLEDPSHQENSELVEGWQFYQFPRNEFQAGLSSTEFYSGKQSAYMINKVPTQTGVGYINQSLNALPFRGKQIQFSAFFKTYKVMKRTFIFAIVFDENHNEIAYSNPQQQYLLGDNDWTLLNASIDIPENASYLVYGARVEGQGQVWVDDFSFQLIESTGNSTIYANDLRQYDPPFTPERKRYLEKIGFRLETNTKLSKLTLNQDISEWYVSDAVLQEYSVKQDEQTPYNNLPSIKIASKQGDAYLGTMLKRIQVDTTPATGIKFSAYVKSNFVKGGASVWLRIEGEDGLALEFDNLMRDSQLGSNNWQKMEVVLPLPEQAKFISFGALLMRTGELWFAEPKLEFVSQLPEREVSNVLLQPTNLSFE